MNDRRESQSLIGLTLDELGQPTVRTTHTDGSVETHPLEQTTKHASDPNPHTWVHAGGALVAKEAAGLSRSERIDQSLRVEAALVKGFTSPSGIKNLTDRHARLILLEVLRAMGGEWQAEAIALGKQHST